VHSNMMSLQTTFQVLLSTPSLSSAVITSPTHVIAGGTMHPPFSFNFLDSDRSVMKLPVSTVVQYMDVSSGTTLKHHVVEFSNGSISISLCDIVRAIESVIICVSSSALRVCSNAFDVISAQPSGVYIKASKHPRFPHISVVAILVDVFGNIWNFFGLDAAFSLSSNVSSLLDEGVSAFSVNGIWNTSLLLPPNHFGLFLRVGFYCQTFNISGFSAVFNVSGPAAGAVMSRMVAASVVAGAVLEPVLVTLVDGQGERCWSCVGDAFVSAVGSNGTAGVGWSDDVLGLYAGIVSQGSGALHILAPNQNFAGSVCIRGNGHNLSLTITNYSGISAGDVSVLGLTSTAFAGVPLVPFSVSLRTMSSQICFAPLTIRFQCSDQVMYKNDLAIPNNGVFTVDDVTLFEAKACHLLISSEALLLSTFSISISPSAPASFKLVSSFPSSVAQYNNLPTLLLQLTDMFQNNISVSDSANVVNVSVQRRSRLRILSGAISGNSTAFLSNGIAEFPAISFNLAPAELRLVFTWKNISLVSPSISVSLELLRIADVSGVPQHILNASSLSSFFVLCPSAILCSGSVVVSILPTAGAALNGSLTSSFSSNIAKFSDIAVTYLFGQTDRILAFSFSGTPLLQTSFSDILYISGVAVQLIVVTQRRGTGCCCCPCHRCTAFFTRLSFWKRYNVFQHEQSCTSACVASGAFVLCRQHTL
jgi:hypothetical protein